MTQPDNYRQYFEPCSKSNDKISITKHFNEICIKIPTKNPTTNNTLKTLALLNI